MGRMEAPESGVTIRMYRQGLGDCFLLAVRGEDHEPRYLMIDCGILKNSPQEKERMQRVLEHVAEATGNHVHVLVATHEHWDHVCGFEHAREQFERLTVDEVWLAWTEDRSDARAETLRRKHEQAFRAVQAALTKMHLAADPAVNETALRMEALNDFFGGAPAAAPGSPFGFSKNTDAVMESVRTKPGASQF